MKSWISFLLPNDEYKEKKMLYFLSEGAIILFVSLIVMRICNKYFNLDVEVVLFASIALFIAYMYGRYIFSGIEYTDIITDKAYKKQLRVIMVKSIGFVIILTTSYLIFTKMPTTYIEWSKTLSAVLCGSLLLFAIDFISLKRSYEKNKELL